ncbi:MAG TPA: glycosyltransferase [Streptosporangiaceae bacterium]|nr:glycosyltransferase [Streptosporangiaceae bacterium]
MRVLIPAEGTRGELQPCLALAKALDEAGHEAVIAAFSRSNEYARDYGPYVIALGEHGPITPMNDIGPKITRGGVRGMLARVELARVLRPALLEVLDELWEVAAKGADLVLCLPGIMGGHHLAERLGVPGVAMMLAPLYVPRSDLPNPLLRRRVPGRLNRGTYVLSRGLALPYQSTIDAWRERTLGLPHRPGQRDPLRRPDGRPAPVLNAYSRHVVPAAPDAGPHVFTTGFWLPGVPERWRPPPDLDTFIAGGEPPVYVGFGSMHGHRPDQAWHTVLTALRQLSVRAVVSTGWGGLRPQGTEQDDVYVVGDVPHAWLFPRMAAVVHHGGAGTTATALAAGVPQVICPFFFDQPFWGERMHHLGVAPRPLPMRSLTAPALADAIGRALTADRARQAARLGELVSAEDGTATAVAQLERLVQRGGSST